MNLSISHGGRIMLPLAWLRIGEAMLRWLKPHLALLAEQIIKNFITDLLCSDTSMLKILFTSTTTSPRAPSLEGTVI
jgi:hypothetical protein